MGLPKSVLLAHGISRVSISGGLTTAAFVQVAFFESLSLGIPAISGTLKNTDVTNALKAKETVVDLFGNTETHTSTLINGDLQAIKVLGGGAVSGAPSVPAWMDGTSLSVSQPPIASYKLEVSDFVAAMHAAFDLQAISLTT